MGGASHHLHLLFCKGVYSTKMHSNAVAFKVIPKLRSFLVEILLKISLNNALSVGARFLSA